MKLHISNSAARDATVVAHSIPEAPGVITVKNNQPVTFRRYVAAGEGKLHVDLSERLSADYAKDLISGDPEVDLEIVGRYIEKTNTVLISTENQPLFCAPEIVEITYGPDGQEISRRAPVDTPPNVNEATAIKWSGRLMSRADLIRKFAIKRSMQIRHIDGVTFDFLQSIAKELSDKQSVMLLGAGDDGKSPLVLQSNGSAYRGFLDGRIDGDKYLLLLHLSNLELKKPAPKAAKE
jgi:hypothetical protein